MLNAFRLLAFATICLWTLPLAAQPQADEETLAMRGVQIDVAYLASDLLEGRAPGTPGEAMAATYIVDRLAELGVAPGGADGSWYQPFTFRFSPNPHATADQMIEGTARNVVGLIDNGADQTVVIGAHYDHLGYGGAGSLAPGDSAIHNGADDNASGTAAMLEIARQLAQSDATSNNYLFLAFSAEEMGLHGSKFFVQNPTLALEDINYMLNLDMVGRLSEDRRLSVNGTGTSPAWAEALDAAGAAHDLTVVGSESGVGASDHTSFYLEDLPVLHLFTGAHEDYHKPADDSHLINYEGLLDVADFAVTLIETLDDDGKIAFTKTQDESQRSAMAFKVSLGVMPDYVYDGEGMRVDAVLDGRPAALAGLERGDVIIKLGPVDVLDVYDYMEALSQFEVGDTATVVVQRGGERVEAEVTF